MRASQVLCTVELEACAVAVGAHRGREGNLVRTLIRPNGRCKVARSAGTRQEAKTEEKIRGAVSMSAWM